MPRVSNSTKAASKEGSAKSSKKLQGGSKPVRHRRSVAGCQACRIRGKPCDQQLFVDARGLTTCTNCHKLKIACVGGFGDRKVPDDQWKFWFRLRVKLYMRETGKVRGIKGWSRSGPDLRKTPLALEEIHGFVDSHVHLSRDEGENHETCIFYENGKCPARAASPAGPQYSQLLMSPANTDVSSDFSLMDHDSPIVPIISIGHHSEGPLFEPISPDASAVMSLPYNANALLFTPYNDAPFTENPVQSLNAWPIQPVLNTLGLGQYGVGLPDVNVPSTQLSDSEGYDALVAQPLNVADYLDLSSLDLGLLASLLPNDDSQLSGFTRDVYDA